MAKEFPYNKAEYTPEGAETILKFVSGEVPDRSKMDKEELEKHEKRLKTLWHAFMRK
jgi:hypothetical protein